MMSLEDYLNLPEAKQKEIFKVALQEFSTYGYDLASTNRIVAQAGISKGMLFKYFTSKEGLFLYIIDRDPVATLYKESLSQFPDIFAYMEHMTRTEIEAIANDPEARLFFFLINRMILDPNHPIYARALSRFLTPIDRIIDEYCDQMDEGLLKDWLSVLDLKKMLHFLLDSMRMTANQNPERLLADTDGAIQDAKLIYSIARAGMFK